MAFFWLEYIYMVILFHGQTFEDPPGVKNETLPTSIPEELCLVLGE